MLASLMLAVAILVMPPNIVHGASSPHHSAMNIAGPTTPHVPPQGHDMAATHGKHTTCDTLESRHAHGDASSQCCNDTCVFGVLLVGMPDFAAHETEGTYAMLPVQVHSAQSTGLLRPPQTLI